MNDLNRGMGDNAPPDDIIILREQLADEAAPLIARRDELLASADRAPDEILDEEAAGKVADLIRLIAACHKAAEGSRVARKEPFLASERAVDGFFKKITDPLAQAKRIIEGRLTAYQRRKAEDERRRREEAERAARAEADRLRREAEAKAAALKTEQDLAAAVTAEAQAKQAAADAESAAKNAAAKAAELSRSRGNLGAVASLRTFWDFAEIDRAAIDLETLRQHLPMTAIETAVRSFVKAGGRQLRGVRIFENSTTSVR